MEESRLVRDETMLETFLTARWSAGLCAGAQGCSLAVFNLADVVKGRVPCQKVRGVESILVQHGPRYVLSSPPPSAEPWVAGEGDVFFHTCLLGGDREVWLQMKEKSTE